VALLVLAVAAKRLEFGYELALLLFRSFELDPQARTVLQQLAIALLDRRQLFSEETQSLPKLLVDVLEVLLVLAFQLVVRLEVPLL